MPPNNQRQDKTRNHLLSFPWGIKTALRAAFLPQTAHLSFSNPKEP
jgi:hypothetical protein